MKSKKTLLIIVAAFVLLLVGAYLLYSLLGESQAPEQLAINEQHRQDDTASAQPDSSTDTDGSADTDASTDADDSANSDDPEPMLAPDFTVYDLDGNAVNLSDYVGKPVVLNFWASWCGPCQMEMPDFQEKYLELGEDVHFLMVNMTDGSRETVELASEFIAEREYTFPVFYDTDIDAAMTYGVYSIPTTYFIDAEGYAIAQAAGAIDADTLQVGIDLIAGE